MAMRDRRLSGRAVGSRCRVARGAHRLFLIEYPPVPNKSIITVVSKTLSVSEEHSSGNQDQAQKRVFLCYKRGVSPDETLVACVYDTLRQQHQVFFDKLLPVGAEWRVRLLTEIDRCDFVVLLLSKVAALSEYVEYEIDTAHRLGQARGGKPRILPVRVSYHESLRHPLAAYLNHLNHIRWESEADTDPMLHNLSVAIQGGDVTFNRLGAVVTDPISPLAEAVPQPRPAADLLTLERPDGTIDPESQLYIDRPADSVCHQTLEREWARERSTTLVIKAPRQMGKSSLLVRAARQAAKAGRRVAFLDFHLIDEVNLREPEALFKGFCHWLVDELDLEDTVESFWKSELGHVQLCTKYVRRRIIEALDRPLFLAMDEVDRMLTCSFRSDFFGMLRSWHNKRATDAAWRRLDLALIISTEPYLLIEQGAQSPFNVGEVIALDDFTSTQVEETNRRHGTPFSPRQLDELQSIVGGHPYLVRQAMYSVVSGKYSIRELLARATDDEGPFGDHLRRHLVQLAAMPRVAAAFRNVLQRNTCQDELLLSRLQGGGLVRRTGHSVSARCSLYARYFGERLEHG